MQSLTALAGLVFWLAYLLMLMKGVLLALGKQLAMHIAATSPASLSIDDLDPAIVQRERDVLIEQAKSSGKPQDIAEKMVEGRMRKYYEEVVLLEQTFV